MIRTLSSLLLMVLVSGCWADFPASRLRDGASSDSQGDQLRVDAGDLAVADGQPADGVRADGVPDGPMADGPRPDGPVSDVVTPDGPQPDNLTPDTLTPDTLAADQTPAVDTLRPDLLLTEMCTDNDTDGVTSCAGDCDDGDIDVFTGQTRWFETTRQSGGYDFDCSGFEEPELPNVVNCFFDANDNCVGDGWGDTTVPACGMQGIWTPCRVTGINCKAASTSTLTQRCH